MPSLGASAVGVYMHILMNIGGFLTFLGCALGIAWLLLVSPNEERKRFGILMVTALLVGATLGPLAISAPSSTLLNFNWNILVTAFVRIAIAFGCLSGAAVVVKRREFLYLGGLLSSGMSILFWLRYSSSIFSRSAAMYNVELYVGRLLFLGYVVFDTQETIGRAHLGDLAYLNDAYEKSDDEKKKEKKSS